MAHHITIKAVPYTKQDGSVSATKKVYKVIDRTRGGRVVEVGVCASKKAAEELCASHRDFLAAQHLRMHPKDTHFMSKYKREGSQR